MTEPPQDEELTYILLQRDLDELLIREYRSGFEEGLKKTTKQILIGIGIVSTLAGLCLGQVAAERISSEYFERKQQYTIERIVVENEQKYTKQYSCTPQGKLLQEEVEVLPENVYFIFIPKDVCPEGSRVSDLIQTFDYNNDGKPDEFRHYHIGWYANTNMPYLSQTTVIWNGNVTLESEAKKPGYSKGNFVARVQKGNQVTTEITQAFMDLYIDGIVDPFRIRTDIRWISEEEREVSEVIIDNNLEENVVMSCTKKTDTNGRILGITITYPDNTTEQWTREKGWPWQQDEFTQNQTPTPTN
jgi:hypothetical protein